MKTLAELLPGETAIIESCADSPYSLKLLEMGCIPGERIILERIAPLGDPKMFRVSGYVLSLRKEEAEQIEIHIEQ